MLSNKLERIFNQCPFKLFDKGKPITEQTQVRRPTVEEILSVSNDKARQLPSEALHYIEEPMTWQTKMKPADKPIALPKDDFESNEPDEPDVSE